MKFGSVNQCIVFGGSRLLLEFADYLRQEGWACLVVVSERHAQERVDCHSGATLSELLQQREIECISSADVNNDTQIHNRITAQTLGISICGAWIFRRRFIDTFEGRFVNLHGSRLPYDRGGAGFSWSILRNESRGMSLIHRVDEGIDTGDILTYREYHYPASCRLPLDYLNHSIEQYMHCLRDFMGDVQKGKDFFPLAQPPYLSTYWPRLATDRHAYINWSWRLEDIERFICAFDKPYGGAITFWRGKRVRITGCYTTISDGSFHPFQQGIIYRVSRDACYVAAAQGSVIATEVKTDGPEGESIMSLLVPGDRFVTPQKHLDEALEYRAIYTPMGLAE